MGKNNIKMNETFIKKVLRSDEVLIPITKSLCSICNKIDSKMNAIETSSLDVKCGLEIVSNIVKKIILKSYFEPIYYLSPDTDEPISTIKFNIKERIRSQDIMGYASSLIDNISSSLYQDVDSTNNSNETIIDNIASIIVELHEILDNLMVEYSNMYNLGCAHREINLRYLIELRRFEYIKFITSLMENQLKCDTKELEYFPADMKSRYLFEVYIDNLHDSIKLLLEEEIESIPNDFIDIRNNMITLSENFIMDEDEISIIINKYYNDCTKPVMLDVLLNSAFNYVKIEIAKLISEIELGKSINELDYIKNNSVLASKIFAKFMDI